MKTFWSDQRLQFGAELQRFLAPSSGNDVLDYIHHEDPTFKDNTHTKKDNEWNKV
jgi:hypothetical protein